MKSKLLSTKFMGPTTSGLLALVNEAVTLGFSFRVMVLVVAASLGHMYLGTVGVEGALEGMTTGRVDEAWGLEHHDLWAKEVVAAEEKERTAISAAVEGHGR